MSDNTELNPGYGGDIYAADDVDGIKYQRVKLVHGADGVNDGDVATGNGLPVTPANITTKFRESFESFVDGVKWDLVQDANDIVQLDGNAASASYLVISKDPLTTGGVTTLTSVDTFDMPVELSVGLSMSQRVLGQEVSMEFISTEEALPAVADVAIASISQTTTTITVSTVTPHGLVPGKRIGIYGCVDSRLNYPSLVVATIFSPTQFTVTAGPAGTIPSGTLSGAAAGYVYFRSSMGYAQNGFSQIFENASATNASIYTRSSAGDSLPSGTIGGNHTVTVGTTAPTQAAVSPYTYSFLPGSEFRMAIQADRVQAYDSPVDSASAQSSRTIRTQVVPDSTKQYKLRFRVTNDKGLTIPNAKVVSASKSGSTTATITTDVPHGLTTNDYVVVYGIRDQTNFGNLTTQQVVASVISSTQFTVVFGVSATATSYGGYVARGQGSNIPGAFLQVGAQSATLTASELTLVGNLSWAVSVGDYVNVYGVRDNTTGADLGVDGTYKVVNVSTTTLVLSPIGSTVLPASFGLTNCGGAVIKRTDLRLSFARVFDYLRERVEILPRPDQAAAVGVYMVGGVLGSGTLATQPNPNQISTDIASAALTSTNTSAAITPSNSSLSCEFNVIVTAASGTNQTLDVVVQESDDSGTNWYDIYHFPRITAVGQYRSPLTNLTGNRVRYVRTVGGTSPSFTHAVNRQQSNVSNPIQRQFFTRIDMNTLNTTTASFFTEGCVDFNVVVAMGAVTTTAPVLAFEVSADGSIWTQVGGDITTVANAAVLLQISNVQARFSRLRTKTAGSGAATNFMMFKGVGR